MTNKKRLSIYGQPIVAAIHYLGKAGLTLQQARLVLDENKIPESGSLATHLLCATRTNKTSAPVKAHREVMASFDAETRSKILAFKKVEPTVEDKPAEAKAAENAAPVAEGKPLLPQPKAGKVKKASKKKVAGDKKLAAARAKKSAAPAAA